MILSDPTSGTVAPCSPRGTQTRRRPSRRMARRRPADDRTSSEGVSNEPKGRWRPAPPPAMSHGYPLGVCANRLATPSGPVLSSPGPRRRRRSRETPAGLTEVAQAADIRPRRMDVDRDGPPPSHPGTLGQRYLSIVVIPNEGPIERMDAKQVWRAALGELQVSLSPANYETWLRDTQLVDVDEQRFRIAVPNGFAKDWLETRYRSLISQTLARIVGYSVQVEFLVGPTPTNGIGRTATTARRRSTPRPGRAPSRCGSSRRASVVTAGRPTSTRATRSRTSSSGRPTGWPTRPACPSPSDRATPTTRSSCMAASGLARPT